MDEKVGVGDVVWEGGWGIFSGGGIQKYLTRNGD